MLESKVSCSLKLKPFCTQCGMRTKYIYLIDNALTEVICHLPILSTTKDMHVKTDILVSHSLASLKSANKDENVDCTKFSNCAESNSKSPNMLINALNEANKFQRKSDFIVYRAQYK